VNVQNINATYTRPSNSIKAMRMLLKAVFPFMNYTRSLCEKNIFSGKNAASLILITDSTPRLEMPSLDRSMNNSETQSTVSLPRLFLMCESCFWCASALRHIELVQCPLCNKETLSSLPLSKDEKYSYSYNEKRGVELAFASAAKAR
jgi:hypothetical protein